MRTPLIFSCMCLAVSVAACSSDTPTRPPVGQPGIHSVLGASVTDTVDALLPQALVVEVRNADGQTASGIVVRFEAQPPRDTARRNEPALFVCPLSAPLCGPTVPSTFASDTTDNQGRAKILVRLGHVAGTAVVRLSAPELALADSAAFTVTPGAPSSVRAVSADLGLDIGATSPIRGRVVDRYNNTRPEIPTVTVGAGTSISLDAATGVVTGRDVGTQFVFTRFATFVDSTSVRVVPGGRLVVWSSNERVVRLVNVNGTSVRTLVSSVSSDLGAFPRFDATRQRVTLHSGSSSFGGPPNSVIVVDTATGAQRIIPQATGFNIVVATRQIAGGALLVVGQRVAGGPFALWRVEQDNTITMTASITGLGQTYGGADISHDGTRVAYLVNNELRVLNVASGAVTVLEPSARSPRWSMAGDRIAYLVPAAGTFSELDGSVVVINVDGTGRRTVGSAIFSPGLAWSPDGLYIVGRSSVSPPGFALRLLRVSDGNSIVLTFRGAAGELSDYFQPDWR